ncbi:MAG TPA: hypothetical protein VHL58_06345 [Thermoanaerobaculia bacterium]|nr:hypothetical protein [Thermoanaerobaculia bacterium]
MAKHSSDKTTSTNTTFFKTGGRLAATKKFETQAEEKVFMDHPHGEKMEGKKGQPNFIPGEAPVGQRGSTKPAMKK